MQLYYDMYELQWWETFDHNLSHLYEYTYFRTTYQNSHSHVSINQSGYLQKAGTTRTETFDHN